MIVDSNIVVKWFVAEDDSDTALALRLQGELFAPDIMLIEYRNALLEVIIKAKPATAKGTYVKSVFMASSMSPGIAIDTKAFAH